MRRSSRAALFFLLAAALGVAACSPGESASTTSSGASASERPNVVVLFADDLGYGDLSSYGHPTIRTPNLDRMARQGIRLTSFYAQAWCVPSRAALLTGRYPIRVDLGGGTGAGGTGGLPASEVTLAEALGAAGYHTAMIGKWHLGYARDEYLPTMNGGFDSWFGLPYSHDYKRPWVQTDVPLRFYRDTVRLDGKVDPSTLTTRYTEKAVSFIRSSGDEPFFLYMAYNMPHLPVATAERFRGQSRAGKYGDVVETIDWSAGRILQALEEEGLSKNTIVIFTSDNGPWLDPPPRMLQAGNKRWHTGSAGLLRGAKAMTYEGGMRVPCIIRWPARIPAGQTSAEITTTMDLFVTLVEAAGRSVPPDSVRTTDGHNLLPFLTDQTEESPTEVFYFFLGRRLEGVRKGPWKLRASRQTWTTERVRLPEGESVVELFHLGRDPAERYNVADKHPAIVRRLKEQMRTFADKVGAELPSPLASD